MQNKTEDTVMFDPLFARIWQSKQQRSTTAKHNQFSLKNKSRIGLFVSQKQFIKRPFRWEKIK